MIYDDPPSLLPSCKHSQSTRMKDASKNQAYCQIFDLKSSSLPKTIILCDQKQETKDSIGPPLCCPHNLNAYWTMLFGIVVVNCMTILEVVVNHFWILEQLHHVCPALLQVMSHLFAIQPIIGAIG